MCDNPEVTKRAWDIEAACCSSLPHLVTLDEALNSLNLSFLLCKVGLVDHLLDCCEGTWITTSP